jgi:predicted Fe-S protein YdhL (DUF1289 family)
MMSPCIKICTLDPKRSFCTGCGRTLDEIARWSTMSDEERRAVTRTLAERLARQPAD